ncbi:MAG: M14 family zinc carboxypeptidase [Bacteroidales bacterium]|nr:M14 family zinc carboxypeptidase [Bacteroidales bacterium]
MKHLLLLLSYAMASLTISSHAACKSYGSIVNPCVPYSHEQMVADLEQLLQRYSAILSRASIGTSVEGRDIPVVCLGRGEHDILVCGAMHARECITTNYLMYFIEQYAEAFVSHDSIGDFDVNHLLNNVSIHIAPMINPDGVNIVQGGFEASCHCDSLLQMKLINYEEPPHRSWKANAHGVDLNRNFDFGWDNCPTDSLPASNGFKGFAPLSEPESHALASFAKRIRPEAVLAFHTQGEQFFFTTPDSCSASIAERLVEATGFEPQPIDPPYGSFQDFVALHLGVFYACVELCDYIGPRPYPECDFFKIWQPARYVIPIVASGIIDNQR